MSNSDAEKQNVRLVASAEDGTEIFVIDGRFRRVASALNRMETALPPGLYTVKFKRGSALAEVDTDLLPGSGLVEVRAPEDELAFDSAAPMGQTTTSHEYHQAAAARISRTDPVKIGEGQSGRLLLFVRDIGADGIGRLAEGITLHDLRGRKVIDFAAFGETGHRQDTSGAAWYGCNFELSPGFYRLRVSREGMPGLEQSLILVKDWQLQVFLVRNPWLPAVSADISGQPHASRENVNLAEGTVFMARPDHGFDPWDPSVRLTELARQGLVTGRIPVTDQDLVQMLVGKFENPMLGLFGAHLLMPLLALGSSTALQRPTDPEILKGNRAIQSVLSVSADGIVGPRTRQRLRQLLEEVVGNLGRMLGEHPDVRALHSELVGDGSGRAVTKGDGPPPMLRRSWETLVRSDPFYRQAKAGSILERIADRIWGPGPWLVWEVPPAASRTRDFNPGTFGKLLSIIGDSAAETGELAQAMGKAGLNLMEESLVMNSLKQVEISSLRKITADVPTTGTDASSLEETTPETAKLMGIPVMTLKRNLASAMAKIDAAVESRSDSLRKFAGIFQKE
jgi:hypothetical protein